MKNQEEINNLVNTAMYHVEYALQSVEESQILSTDSKYLFDLFNSVFSNLAGAKYYLSIANNITEKISV